MNRITTIDFTRGLVMLIMAIDHVRDLMHIDSLTQDPTNLTTTTLSLFMTRWITHLCAPTFVFLSGTSVYLLTKQQGDIAASRRFLLTRGLWLIVLEFTIINFSLWFDVQFRILVLQVIAAIGIGFILISVLLNLPARLLGLIGFLIVSLHGLLPAPTSSGLAGPFLWSFLFRPGIFPVTPHFTFGVLYPVIPWFGIMLMGYSLGPLMERPQALRKRFLFRLGGLVLLIFLIVRFLNIGDPAPWSVQKSGLYTVLSFINCSKYPPSLAFTAMTLGIALLILALADGVTNRFTRLVTVYGKVPLFYYLIHWYLIHSTLLLLMLLQGFRWQDLQFEPFRFGRPATESGVDLPTIYLIWLGIIIALYPLCRWYSRYKASHRNNPWVKYI